MSRPSLCCCVLPWLLAVSCVALGCGDEPAPTGAHATAMPPAPACYSFETNPNRSSISAHNAAQGLDVELHRGMLRLTVAPDTQPWSFAMEWTRYGRGENLAPVPAAEPHAAVARNRASLQRGPALTEWYVNRPVGLEQGFVLGEEPAANAAEPVTIELQIHGDVAPTASAGGTAVTLHPRGSTSRLAYAKLAVRDALDRSVPAWLETSASAIVLRIQDRAARYPLYVDPIFTAETKLISGGVVTDAMGQAVALSGTTAMAGVALNDDVAANAGVVYAFERSALSWSAPTSLYASDASGSDRFGSSVTVAGDDAIVGAPGAGAPALNSGRAYVLARNGSSWNEQATLEGDGTATDALGSAVALHDDTALVGAPEDDLLGGSTQENKGSAYVFVRSASTWSEQQKLTASDSASNKYFGQAVAVQGDTAVIGSPGRIIAGYNGAAYVFSRTGSMWTEDQKIVDPQGGSGDHFGCSVSLDGDTLLVGNERDESGSARIGAVFVFTRSGASWSLQQRLTASDSHDQALFGTAAALLGDVAFVGAPGSLGGSPPVSSGAAYVFGRTGSTWTQDQKIEASDGSQGDQFGASVAMAGGWSLVGAPGTEGGRGGVYAYLEEQPAGSPCADNAHCLSGYCVDSVCCSVACGGDDPDDCLVCSVAAGAAQDGECAPLSDGTSCDDGLFCTVVDACAAGACAGTGDPCPQSADGDSDCHESCDEAADDCSGYDGDGVPCDDGIFCNGIEQCLAGGCASSGQGPCPGPDGDDDCHESCDEEARACDGYDGDGAPCMHGTCLDGACSAGLGSPCTTDSDCREGYCVEGICCEATSCGAYRCSPEGSCLQRCYTTADCAVGYQCSADSTCRAAGTNVDDGGACGCALPGKRRSSPVWLITTCCAIGWPFRRRRERTRRTPRCG